MKSVDPPVTRAHFETFLDIVDSGSIHAAARLRGRSRATCGRLLQELEATFDGTVLVRRAPGQRTVALTPAGTQLAHRVRPFLRHWERWLAATRDVVLGTHVGVRVGVLVGAFDLLADVLTEMRNDDPALGMHLHVVEFAHGELLEAVASGRVDIGFGTATLAPEGMPRHLQFHAIGPLPWVVLLPQERAGSFPARVSLVDLDGQPMVVSRAGPARESIERSFNNATQEGRPLTFNPAFEVGSSPRIVEAVARGFGIAVVSRFRALFVQKGVVVRELKGGPPTLTAGAFTRKGSPLEGPTLILLEGARQQFRTLARAQRAVTGPGKRTRR